MFMKSIHVLIASALLLLVSCSAGDSWVRVEGNKFIDPQGKEIVFRGLCFSDPVKLVRDGQWNERYFAEAAAWGSNVVRFAVHPANLNSMGWEEHWEETYGFVADTYPVICTEIGFCLENEPGAHIPVISTEEYGKHITQYLEKKGISFTVWCFDTRWAPMLIWDWDFTPTTQGAFFKDYLQSVGKDASK